MTSNPSSSARAGLTIRLAPILFVVFIVFLIIGMALPVLPLHVQNDLGFGPVTVGIVAGSQFIASLLSRISAGRFSDQHGGKRAVISGLIGASAAGGLYMVSVLLIAAPAISASILILGRALLGGAESFIITGALAWALRLANKADTGKVISWVGTAMYAAFALGAPVGSGLHAALGFSAIAIGTIAFPLLSLLLIARIPGVEELQTPTASVGRVLSAIWLPGVGLALSSIGFGAMTAFSTLLFLSRGWDAAWLPFSLFALSFIVMRTVWGSLPDRFGGAKIAFLFIFVEAAGLALIWIAPTALVAMAGAILTGVGYSLVYPGLGVEAVQGVDSESRGLAMGSFTAFLDLALGVASPLLGIVAAISNLGVVFLVSALAVFASSIIAGRLLLRAPVRGEAG